MLVIEVVAAVAASACGLLAVLVGKGQDTWGARHPALFWLFVSVSLISLAALLVLAVAGDRQTKRASQETRTLLENASTERDTLLGEVQDLGVQLAPFIEAASRLYPDVESEEALRLLTSRLDVLEERTQKLELEQLFWPLDTIIRAQVVRQLRSSMSGAAVRRASVHVECEVKSNSRLELGSEIVEILAEAGYDSTGPTTTARVYAGQQPSVAIKCSPSCEDLANMIYAALHLVLKTEFAGERADDVEGECPFILYIGGDPLFEADGTVEFC